MKKPYKRPFRFFAIFAVIMFVAVAALFVINHVVVEKIEFGNLYDRVLFPHYFDLANIFDTVIKFNHVGFSVKWIVTAVFALFFLVMMFIAIFAVKKKKGAKAFCIVLAILGIVVAYFGIPALYSSFDKGIKSFQNGDIGYMFLYLGFDAVVVLYFIASISGIINAVRYARRDVPQDSEVLPEVVEEPQEPEQVPEAVEEPATVEELPVFIPEPEEEVQIDPQNLSTTALAAIIKDIVRDIVRDELERNNLVEQKEECKCNNGGTSSVVGATFGGPLIVQYFNGGIQSAVPAPAPQPEPVKEEPKSEPVVEEEKKPEPQPEPVVEEVKPEPVVEEVKPEPVPAPTPVVEEPKEPKAPIVRIPFDERLLSSEKELQEIYSEIKNEILSYGVKSRVSSSGDTFRLHRKTYVKITVAGKSLKLYFALNPDDYRESAIPVQDASEKSIYEEIPLVFKVKSPLSVRRCKQLIQDVMEKDNLEQGEIGTVNWIKELRADMKARKAEKK